MTWAADDDGGPQYADRFAPMLKLRDYVAILDFSGLMGLHAGGPLYQVTGVIPVPGIGPKGSLGLWMDPTTGALPSGLAGFKFDMNAQNGHIGAGAETRISPVQQLVLKWNQIGQFRLRFKAQPQPTGQLNDYDFRVYQPSSSLLWQSQNFQGAYNLADQAMDPGDNQLFPGQGQGETPSTVGFEIDHLWSKFTEVLCVEDQSLTIGITNNGAAPTTAGAWLLRARGFIFNLQGIAGGPAMEILPGINCPTPPGGSINDVKLVQYGYKDPYLGTAFGGVGPSA